MKPAGLARLWVLLAVTFWGISFVATKAALRELSPPTLIFLRFALGVVLLVSLVRLRGDRVLPPRQNWLMLMLMGFIGIFVHQLLQSFGLTMTTATETGWLIGLIPVWSAALSALVLHERFGWMKLVGLGGGFAGAALVVSKGRVGGLLHLPSTRGDFLVLLSTINWAVYTVLGQKTLKALGPLRATAGMMLAGTLMLAPLFAWTQGWRELHGLSPAGWGAVLFLGIACSGLGYLFWYGALEKIEASRVSSFLYIEPFVTLLAAFFLLHECIQAVTIVGGLLVLSSVYLLQRAPS